MKRLDALAASIAKQVLLDAEGRAGEETAEEIAGMIEIRISQATTEVRLAAKADVTEAVADAVKKATAKPAKKAA